MLKAWEWLHDTFDEPTDECVEWEYHVSNSRYGKFTKDGRTYYAHRYVCAYFHGPAPADHDAAHSCNNRLCVNERHISWKTRQENIADKIEHGTHTCGEIHSRSKLTEEQAIAIIRDERKNKYIAADYGVSQQQVRAIKIGDSWPHLSWTRNQAARL